MELLAFGAVEVGEKEFPFFVDWGSCGGSLMSMRTLL